MILQRGWARGYIVMPSYGQAHILKYLSHTNFFPLYDWEGMVFFKLHAVIRSRNVGWWDWGPPAQGEQRGPQVSLAVQSLSHLWLFVTPRTAARQAFLSCTISQSLLKLMSIDSVMSSNHLILCHPLLLLPSIFPASGSFPISQLLESGGQSIGASSIHEIFQARVLEWGAIAFSDYSYRTLLFIHSLSFTLLFIHSISFFI